MDGDQIIKVEMICNEETTPCNFFVRTLKQKAAFDAFDSELQEVYKQSRPKIKEDEFQDGLLVVLAEGRYRRGKFLGIERVVGEGLYPKVYLIDEGKSVRVRFDACRGITPQFVKEPSFAFRCHLHYYSDEDSVSDEATKFFRDACVDNRFNFTLLFRSYEKMKKNRQWSALVDLQWQETIFDTPYDKGRTVTCFMSTKMISLGLVQMTHRPPLYAEVAVLVDSDQEDNQDEVLPNRVLKWERAIVREDLQEHFTRVRVTHVDEYCQIYYQLFRDCPHVRQMAPTFNSFYSRDGSQSKYDQTPKDWEDGAACVVLWKEDKQWYRARVVKRTSHVTFLVFFVDFGHDYEAHWSKMRIPYHFGDLPSLVHRVIVDKVVPINGDSPAEWNQSNDRDRAANLVYELIGYRTGDDPGCKHVVLKFAECPVPDLPTKATVLRTMSNPDYLNNNKEWESLHLLMRKMRLAATGDIQTKKYRALYDQLSHHSVVTIQKKTSV